MGDIFLARVAGLVWGGGTCFLPVWSVWGTVARRMKGQTNSILFDGHGVLFLSAAIALSTPHCTTETGGVALYIDLLFQRRENASYKSKL